jgi:hypothetical protein
MTAGEFLNEVQRLGGRLEVRAGGRLHIAAPKGVLTPELRSDMAHFKRQLIALLTGTDTDPNLPLDAATVLDTLLSLGAWRTTKQIAAVLNWPAEEVLAELEGLCQTGSAECDGGPTLFIWKAAIEARLAHYGCLVAIDNKTGEASPLFSAGAADIVSDVADIYLGLKFNSLDSSA